MKSEKEILDGLKRGREAAQAIKEHFKQMGACAKDEKNGVAGHALMVPPEAAPLVSHRLRHRKGGDPDEWPADLRVREMPEVAP